MAYIRRFKLPWPMRQNKINAMEKNEWIFWICFLKEACNWHCYGNIPFRFPTEKLIDLRHLRERCENKSIYDLVLDCRNFLHYVYICRLEIIFMKTVFMISILNHNLYCCSNTDWTFPPSPFVMIFLSLLHHLMNWGIWNQRQDYHSYQWRTINLCTDTLYKSNSLPRAWSKWKRISD